MKTITLIFSFFILSCGSSSVKEYHAAKSDTTVTIVLYLTKDFAPKVDNAFRIIKDTSYFDTLNNETAKRVWKKDTSYFIPVSVPMIDSSGKPVLDSLKHPKQQIQFQLMQNKNLILQDYNKHL